VPVISFWLNVCPGLTSSRFLELGLRDHEGAGELHVRNLENLAFLEVSR